MAVIINMELPADCKHCQFSTKCGTNAICLVTMKKIHYSWIGSSMDNPMRPLNCPLKSTDRMIEEIEETYIDNCDFNYQIATDIIYKYCDKEQNND